MAGDSENPLVSNTRASDTSPTVQLHPLVLLTITDCITRHTLRQQKGPVVGAILGQQNGHEVTMEVAFQAKMVSNKQDEVVLDDEWFMERLDDCMSDFPNAEALSALRFKSAPNTDLNRQGRPQATAARHCCLVHTRPAHRPNPPDSAHPHPHIGTHRLTDIVSVPPIRCLLRSHGGRQATAHFVRDCLRECSWRSQR